MNSTRFNFCRFSLAALLVFSSLATNDVRGQDKKKPANLPAASEVLNDFAEALGGEMTLRSLESFKTAGEFHSDSSTLKFETLFSQGKFKTHKKFMGVLTAEIFEGFDGEFLWMDSLGPLPPEQRNSKSSDMELKDRRLASMAAHLSALQWLDHDGEIEVIEKASVDGKQAWCLKFPKHESLPYTALRYFDVESGLLVKAIWKDDNGEIQSEIKFEYHEASFDGVRFWSKQVNNSMGMGTTFEYVYDTIDTSPDIPEDAFKIPERLEDEDKEETKDQRDKSLWGSGGESTK